MRRSVTILAIAALVVVATIGALASQPATRIAVANFWHRLVRDPVGQVDPEMQPVTTTITPTSPCAMSTREVRANHGAEDDLCAAWIDQRGRVHVGPLSDAPARANIVGG